MVVVVVDVVVVDVVVVVGVVVDVNVFGWNVDVAEMVAVRHIARGVIRTIAPCQEKFEKKS